MFKLFTAIEIAIEIACGFEVFQNCYLLSVICNAKNSFMETVNCQTVTLAIDIGFALMMSEMYVFCPYTMLGK